MKKITTPQVVQPIEPRLARSADLQRLLDILKDQHYQTIGPKVVDNAVVYAPLAAVTDLPEGWVDDQSGGHYRLDKTGPAALFNYTVGPQSLKKYLYPAERQFLTVTREGRHIAPSADATTADRRAFLGVRACELAALAIMDRVLLGGPHTDPAYARCREQMVVVAVNCTRPGGTCFCASMKTGPAVTTGYDIALTEVLDGAEHYFLVFAGTPTGTTLLETWSLPTATPAQAAVAEKRVAEAARHMGKTLDTDNLPEILNEAFTDRHWEEIASRCLTCGNCTMVCPTCFCTNVIDTTSLTGDEAQRIRRWDSCHTVGFSYIHGGSIRAGEASRYRQWLMHKLSYWTEQFGTMGCVGCGRCITWCPVGIDITEEAKKLRQRITG